MSEHTPGPWRVEVDRKGDVGVYADEYGVICYPHEDNCQANARLIAAAPELLDALRELEAMIEEWAEDEENNHSELVHDPAMMRARAVLLTIGL